MQIITSDHQKDVFLRASMATLNAIASALSSEGFRVVGGLLHKDLPEGNIHTSKPKAAWLSQNPQTVK
ncbi:hypothetical protein HZA76_02100 [Candidatus Roizmanbacteria bacterium]|nr:hypothetical protein [Candidatus Roizmanbacteria bacterium]